MRVRSWTVGGFGLIVMVLVAACGGGSDSDATSTPEASDPVEVQVTMSDFKFESSLDTFKTGVPYHFVVTNEGTVPHELMLIEPMAPGAMSMTEMDEMAVAVVEEDDLEPGGGNTYTFDLTFTQDYPPGTLEFACHIAGHYEAGMHLPVTVTSS